MKKLFALILVVLPVVGCTINTPPSSTSTTYTTQSDAYTPSSSTTVTRTN